MFSKLEDFFGTSIFGTGAPGARGRPDGHPSRNVAWKLSSDPELLSNVCAESTCELGTTHRYLWLPAA